MKHAVYRLPPFVRLAILAAFTSAAFSPTIRAQNPHAELHVTSQRLVTEFLTSHCADCHQGDDAEGGLNIAALETRLSDPEHFTTWERVYDRVASGEMPPKDYEVLETETKEPFLSSVETWLHDYQAHQFSQFGRVQGRRLTIPQLERTLQDLLGIDIPLATRIPEEPRQGMYSTLAHLQSLSHFQLESIIDVIDVALDEALRRATTGDNLTPIEMTAKQISRKRTRCREPEFIDGSAVVWSSRLIFYGRIPATTARRDGWYRFKISVSALKRPDHRGIWSTIRSGPCVSSAPLMNWIGSFEAEDERKEVEFEAWLPRGHMLEIRPGDYNLKGARFAGGQAANGEGGKQNVAGIAIHSLMMQPIHRGLDDDAQKEQLLGSLPQLVQASTASSHSAADPAITAEAHRLISQFADRAWRRPYDKAAKQPFIELFDASYGEGNPTFEALRAAYRSILCSARFLYFNEPVGPLDDHAIASRLSYAIWNSMPDAELFDLAQQERLRDAVVIEAQIERMLRGERGKRFLADFADQWLQLDQIEATEPDRRMFPTFDLIVQQSMLAETRAFLQNMLEENLPVSQLIHVDFSFLNSRLARYYGLDDIEGDSLRRVTLPADSHRGGLLGQGAVLKVTANGTNTSPVVRGVWVSERLLGAHIPPPPASVPAIEPDVRGATTIRELLAKHRDAPACAACHRKIDPAGFALENFDATGRWREYYPRRKGNRRVQGPKIDASYQLADGTSFDSFEEFCRLQTTRDAEIAAGLVEHLLTYTTGAPIQFADRPEIEDITTQWSDADYPFRSLVKAALTSNIFLSK